MDSDLFMSWLENGFMKGIKERGVMLPVLLLIDGAKSHLSIQASEFCHKNDIILYVLFPNATYLIQPMDLVLMNSIKTVYKEEVRILLQKNPGVLFDKYLFIQVFAVVWQWGTQEEISIKGFEKSGIFPWNPQKIKDGKLAPSSIYERQDPLPEINDSVNEPVNDDVTEPQEGDVPIQVSDEPQPSTSARGTSSDETIAPVFKQPKPKTGLEQPLRLTIGGKKYKLVEEQESVDEILTTPKAKVSRMGGAWMQGLPRCISGQEYRSIIKAEEDKKKKEHEEIEKCKKEHAAKAEEKRVAKQQAQVMQSLKQKRRPMKLPEPSSESEVEEDEVIFVDESSEDSDDSGNESDVYFEGTVNRCAECDTRFVGIEKKRAIGCETSYCHRWFHPKCSGLETKGKTLKQIEKMDFICKYC